MADVRIALVDDQTIFRELVAELLTDERHQIVGQFSSGQDALSALPALAVDLLVLDVVLPDMSGLEMLRQLGAPLRRTQVLLLTGSERPEVVQQAVRLGVDGIVMKGMPLSELREAVRRVEAGGTFFCATSQTLLRQVTQNPVSESLTPRERQIVQLVAQGLSSKEIASRLSVSAKTVANHRVSIMAKLGVHNVAGVTRYAIEQGLINADLPDVC
ncbi:MAG: response regulator transcription factor [Myxococcales bacterium]|nr:response regulator transcription factor [Myxococcales bacterium]